MNLQEQKDYITSISKHTDRELQELQTYYARKQSDYLKSIKSSMNFFYGLGIIIIIAFFIYLYNVDINRKRLVEIQRLENNYR